VDDIACLRAVTGVGELVPGSQTYLVYLERYLRGWRVLHDGAGNPTIGGPSQGRCKLGHAGGTSAARSGV